MNHLINYIEAINEEIDSLKLLVNKTNPDNIERIVNRLLSVKGKVVFTGIGKSGIVAKKLQRLSQARELRVFFFIPLKLFMET